MTEKPVSDNRCIVCGDKIPEGRQVCPICESGRYNGERYADPTAAAAMRSASIAEADARVKSVRTEIVRMAARQGIQMCDIKLRDMATGKLFRYRAES